jgi:hypothetical protein
MSNVNQPPVSPAAPAQAPGSATNTDAATVDVYRRAVEAKPTGFAGNPIGAMAGAADKIGRAAGRIFAGKELEGQDGLGAAEQKLKSATAAARANPNSLEAKQQQFKAALELFDQMKSLPARDPRKEAVATLLVNLANQIGPGALPKIPGLDIMGLLRVAAVISSRFGDAGAMQGAFTLEQMLGKMIAGSSVEAMQLRDQMLARLGVTSSVAKLLKEGWAVKLAGAGEMPSMDASSRTLTLSEAAQNPSLSVLARAWWHDSSLSNMADKDGFMNAFLKIARQGSFAQLDRRYRDVKRLTRDEELGQRRTSALTSSIGAPIMATSGGGSDDSSAMFAALVSHALEQGRDGLPLELQSVLGRFAG